MEDTRRYTCACGGNLMPLWKNNNWVCTNCKLEQSLPKEKDSVDNWYK